MSSPPPKVLIVGGGPSGLILALALAKNGVPVRIIEKDPGPRLGQRGAAMMPRSLELFSYLGLIDQVLQRAIPIPPVRMYALPDGVNVLREFEMAPYTKPTPACPYLNILCLGQDTLEKFLHAALAEYNCHVELGTELISFQQFDDRVEAQLLKPGVDPNSEGVPETASFEWMVGADGARGVVRKQLGLSFLGETRHIENFIVGDIFVEGLSREYWHMWGEITDILISLRPTEVPSMFNFIVGGRGVSHSALADDDDVLRQCFIERTGNRSDIKFKNIAWLSRYTPNIRMVDTFAKGRVFIVGDAGHVHSPSGGQGMNTGVQDSFNLGWKLALVCKKRAPPSLLKSYTEERLPVIAEMLNKTTKILDKTLRKEADAFDRAGSLLQLGVNYRWSSIIVDEQREAEAAEDLEFADYDFGEDEDDRDEYDSYGTRATGVLRAGDRAPDAPGLVPISGSSDNKKRRLFEIFGASFHTVLIFHRSTAQLLLICGVVRAYPEDTVRCVVVLPQEEPHFHAYGGVQVYQDADSHAYHNYSLRDDSGVVIVRPDGFVGGIVKGAVGVKRYFRKIFG